MHSLLACVLPQVLCVQGGVALLGQAELELCHYLAEVDDYIPLACSFHPDAITGDLHIFVVSSMLHSTSDIAIMSGVLERQHSDAASLSFIMHASLPTIPSQGINLAVYAQ